MPWQGRTAQTKRPCLTTPPGNHLFYPRPPRGGRLSVSSIISGFSHISIHALREEGDQGRGNKSERRLISIHALREEGDSVSIIIPAAADNFYPRPPRGGRPYRHHGRIYRNPYFYPRPPRGGRLTGASAPVPHQKFLSTPSARRATTASRCHCSAQVGFLSTPSARRATTRPHSR